MSDLVEIGALWIQEGKNGKYMAGKLGNARLLLFPNQYKKTDKHPDYRLYVSPPRKKEDAQVHEANASLVEKDVPTFNSGQEEVPF